MAVGRAVKGQETCQTFGWHLDCGAPKNDFSTETPFLTVPLTHTALSHQLHRKTSRSV